MSRRNKDVIERAGIAETRQIYENSKGFISNLFYDRLYANDLVSTRR